MHLMRIMEFGLMILHKKVARKKPANPNWDRLIIGIENAIHDKDKIHPRPPSWKKQRHFYLECARHSFFFRDKRNKSVHASLPFYEYEPKQ